MRNRLQGENRLGWDAEQVGNDECLTKGIVFCQPSHPSFPNHVDCFDALQRTPRTLKRAIAFGEPHPFLYDSGIDHIIQVLACAVKGAGPQREKSRPGTGSLHPVAIGAAVEVTKLLKPPV